jgi:hypothetical protein
MTEVSRIIEEAERAEASGTALILASVVAEIQAVRANRSGGHLREFAGPIHERG